MKEIKPCEAPQHKQECNGIGSTRDHFTSIAVGRALGLSYKKLHSQENIQHLSQPCHKAKDDPRTQIELETAKRRGGAKALWERHNEEVMIRRGIPVNQTEWNAYASFSHPIYWKEAQKKLKQKAA